MITRNKKIAYGMIAIDAVLFMVCCKYCGMLAASEIVFVILVAVVFLIGKVELRKRKN